MTSYCQFPDILTHSTTFKVPRLSKLLLSRPTAQGGLESMLDLHFPVLVRMIAQPKQCMIKISSGNATKSKCKEAIDWLRKCAKEPDFTGCV